MAWQQNRRPASEYINRHKAQRVIAAHAGICHLCGHPDAEQVDHVIPWSQWAHHTLSVHDASNLRPAHGQPCPTCGQECHADKSETERVAGIKAKAARGKRPSERHPGSL